jgi:hypothetical protein
MSFDGTYQVSVKTPMGQLQGKLTIKSVGDGFSGSLETPSGTTQFSSGRIQGAGLQWQAETRTPLGKFNVDYSATIEGDRISGEAKTPMGTAPLEGMKI